MYEYLLELLAVKACRAERRRFESEINPILLMVLFISYCMSSKPYTISSLYTAKKDPTLQKTISYAALFTLKTNYS